MKAIFLDRDGTVIVDPPDERVDSIEKIKLFPDTLAALHQLAALDYSVFFVTNQAGIAEGRITEGEFYQINSVVLEQLAPSGIKILKTYMCPHSPSDNCTCRKPKPKLLQDAAKEYGIDLANSWMVGDRQSDIMAGVNAGTKTILVETANAPVSSAEATQTVPHLLDAASYIAAHQAD